MPLLSAIAGLVLAVSSLLRPDVPSSLPRDGYHEAMIGAKLAGRNVRAAQQWLQGRADVDSVQIGRDGRTIDIHFRDGRQIAILPAASRLTQMATTVLESRPTVRDMARAAGIGTGTAVVLEPFATDAVSQPLVDTLQGAGFAVTQLSGSQVTIPVMEGLAQYNLVYFETHSGTLPDGDVILETGETNATPYASFIADHSMIQAVIAGDPNSPLYNAITATFVTKHMGTFHPGSIVFLNGCESLQSPLLWTALQGKQVASLIGWTGQPYVQDGIRIGTAILAELAGGQTVASTIQGGVGVSGSAGSAHLGYEGQGDDTLSDALNGVSPEQPDPTPTPTAAPPPPGLVRTFCSNRLWECVD